MINPILEFLSPPANAGHPGYNRAHWFRSARARQIPIDAFPDVTNVQVQVLATAGGMSPPEVEKLVTRPMEMGMCGLPRLEKFAPSRRSVLRDHDRFRRRHGRLFCSPTGERTASGAARNLPAGVDVALGPITTGLARVFQYTLVSKDPKYDATELRTVQDYIVRPILRTVPGSPT